MRGAKRRRQLEFDYGARAREKPALGIGAYGRLWNIIDGGVKDALATHPDYLTPKGHHSARASIVKRVTGTVIGFAEQSAKGRSNPAETAERATTCEPPASASKSADAGAGASSVSPIDPHCRIGRVRLKRIRREDGAFATAEQKRDRANRRAALNAQLAMYRDLVPPAQRKAEADAYFTRASMRPEKARMG